MKKSSENVQPSKEENNLFWFPFYVNEWLANRAVRFMKDYERGWYISLLVESWADAGTLPDDPDVLWRLAGAQSREFFQANGSLVLSQFEKCEVEGTPCLVSLHYAALYVKQEKKYQQRKEAGRISAERRAAKTGQGSTSQSEGGALNEPATVQ